MMAVEVLSPERVLFQGEASEVYARSTEGEIGILPGHEPALLALDVAPVKVRTAEGEHVFAVYSGFLEMRDNRLIVLADHGEHVGDIDTSAAESHRADAEQRLADDPDDADAKLALKRANLALRLAS